MLKKNEKGNKRYTYWEERKLSLLTDDMIAYLKICKNQPTPRAKKRLQQGYRIQS